MIKRNETWQFAGGMAKSGSDWIGTDDSEFGGVVCCPPDVYLEVSLQEWEIRKHIIVQAPQMLALLEKVLKIHILNWDETEVLLSEIETVVKLARTGYNAPTAETGE